MAKQETIEMEAEIVEPDAMPDAPAGMPSAGYQPSALQEHNPEIDGLDEFDNWLPRVALQNTGGFLYKQGPKKDQTVNELEIVVLKGQRCFEYFDEATQSYAVSYDGVRSTQGEPWSIYANLKDKNNKPAVRKKLELEWEEEDPKSGEPIRYLISLSPTSAGEFKKYADELKKLTGKRVGEVVTVIGYKPMRNRSGQAYQMALFSCKELDAIKAKAAGK